MLMTGVSILLRAFLQIGISFYWASSCHAILISLGHFSISASETGNVKKKDVCCHGGGIWLSSRVYKISGRSKAV